LRKLLLVFRAASGLELVEWFGMVSGIPVASGTHVVGGADAREDVYWNEQRVAEKGPS
jgi:hypothetical protein